jgi:hypothetical protein
MVEWYGLLGVPLLVLLAFAWGTLEQRAADKRQRKWDERLRKYDQWKKKSDSMC